MKSTDAENRFHLLIAIPLLAGCAVSLGLSLYRCFYEIDTVNLIFYAASLRENRPQLLMALIVAAAGLLFLAFKRLDQQEPGRLYRLAVAVSPLLLCGAEAWFPAGLSSLLVFLAATGWTALRIAILFQIKTLPCRLYRRNRGLMIVLAVAALLAGLGFHLQLRALAVQYLCWVDWGVFHNVLINTLDGKWFYSDQIHTNFMGVHFSPALLVLLPLVAATKAPEPFFLINSLLLVSGGVVIFLIARAKRFPTAQGVALALLYLFFPGITNLNLAVMYGFHEIYFVLPLLPAAWYFFERRNWWLFGLLFVFTLGVKETVAAWWCGFALVLLLRREWRSGTLIMVLALTDFLITQKLIMPSLLGRTEYYHLYRYAHLGNSITAIALSPILRPAAFFSSLFRPGCIYYFFTLLLPGGLMILGRPLILLAAVPVFMFVCLQTTDQLQNIMMQYQCMTVATLFIALFEVMDELRQGKISPWFRFLSMGLTPPRAWRLRRLLPAAALYTTAVSFFFLANTPFTKNHTFWYNNPDSTPAIETMKEIIPPNAVLTAPLRVAAHFEGRNRIRHDCDPSSPYGLGEYVLIDLAEASLQGEIIKLRDHLVGSPDFRLLASLPFQGRQYLLFHREKNPGTPLRNNVVQVTDAQWPGYGTPLDSGSSNYSIRVSKTTVNGTDALQFAVRLEKQVDRDAQIVTVLTWPDRSSSSYQIFWGNGLQSTSAKRPRQTFIFHLPMPPGRGFPSTLKAGVIPLN